MIQAVSFAGAGRWVSSADKFGANAQNATKNQNRFTKTFDARRCVSATKMHSQFSLILLNPDLAGRQPGERPGLAGEGHECFEPALAKNAARKNGEAGLVNTADREEAGRVLNALNEACKPPKFICRTATLILSNAPGGIAATVTLPPSHRRSGTVPRRS